MAHHKKHAPEESPSNANLWMISYADMVTLLLAMFIALSAMSQDQTGMSFEQGSQGFRDRSLGWNHGGLSDRGRRVVGLHAPGPVYGLEGPDDPDGGGRSIDGEEERLQRFLNQARSRFSLTRLSPATAQVAVDFYEPLTRAGPLLPPGTRARVSPLLSLARQRNCRVQVVVWSQAPAEALCVRATLRAQALCGELADLGGYDPLMRARLVAVGQPWRFREVRRPVFSVVLVQAD